MATEAMLQLGILILTLSLFFIMHNIQPNYPNNPTQNPTRNNKTHQPEPAPGPSQHRAQHAKNALAIADKALFVWPRDPRVHILQAQALQVTGRRSAAIKSLDAAPASPAARSLSATERAGTLVERAGLKAAVNRRRRIESAVKDLVEAVGLSGAEACDSEEALCFLGKCYEWKGMDEKAKDAFQKVLEVEPDSEEAPEWVATIRTSFK